LCQKRTGAEDSIPRVSTRAPAYGLCCDFVVRENNVGSCPHDTTTTSEPSFLRVRVQGPRDALISPNPFSISISPLVPPFFDPLSPSLFLLVAVPPWPILMASSPRSLSSASYSAPFRFIGIWKVLPFPRFSPSAAIDPFLALLPSSLEHWHAFVHGLGWPGLFECFHQFSRLEQHRGK
jgi:hypothetical protein